MTVVARRASWVARRWARARGRGEPGRWDFCPHVPESAWAHRWHRYTRRLRLLFQRPERWPDDGVDYTGWSARVLRDAGPLKAGAVGTVTGYEQDRRGRRWLIAYGPPELGVDFYTRLPSPGSVELIEPGAA